MTAQLDTWYTTEFGDFIIKKERFLIASFDRDGNRLVSGGTAQAVFLCTPTHLEAKSPGYDGRYDTVLGSAIVGGKL